MQFTDFALSYGLEIKSLWSTDRIQRCGTVEHPKSKNGSYFWDGQRGWVCNWEMDAQTRWFYTDKPWTDAEKQAWKSKQQFNFERQEWKYERAAQNASELLKTATQSTHDYLIRKGFPDELGLVLPDGKLAIPMRNVRTNQLQGLQLIEWVNQKWEKKMMTGMRAKGSVFRMGVKRAAETILCEGYATGLSIHKALRMFGLNMSVVVCFSAGNLVTVAPQIPGKRYVFADNDKTGTGQAKAIETGLPYCMSGVEGNDANDDHQQFGLMAVANKIMDLRVSEVVI